MFKVNDEAKLVGYPFQNVSFDELEILTYQLYLNDRCFANDHDFC